MNVKSRIGVVGVPDLFWRIQYPLSDGIQVHEWNILPCRLLASTGTPLRLR